MTAGEAAHARIPRTTVPLDIGQAEVAALVAVGQARVVDPQEVEDGGVQVVDVDRVLDDVVGEVVGLAVGDPRLMPPPAIQMVKQRGWWSRP